jgi:thiamine biosynthesis lipoprotein
MGTRLDLVLPGLDTRRGDSVMKRVEEELQRLEKKLSFYQTDSDLNLINQTAHRRPFSLDDELHELFTGIMRMHLETKGYLDITLYPVFEFFRDQNNLERSLPEEIRNRVGMENLELDRKGILFKKKGMQIDLGGIGKGFAVEKVTEILQEEGVTDALVSFGGSLVYGLGSHPYGDYWKISVPIEENKPQLQFSLNNEALSTSGNTLNNKKKFANSGHIVNPVTMKMSRMHGGVSVKSISPLRAEAFSTALFSAGSEKTDLILKDVSDLEVDWYLVNS